MHGKLFWSARVDDIDLYIIWFVEHCLIRRSLRLSLTYMLSPSLRYIDCPSSSPPQLFCHMCCCQGGLRAAMPCGIAASALKGWEISFFKVDYLRSAVTFSGLKVSSSSLCWKEALAVCPVAPALSSTSGVVEAVRFPTPAGQGSSHADALRSSSQKKEVLLLICFSWVLFLMLPWTSRVMYVYKPFLLPAAFTMRV